MLETALASVNLYNSYKEPVLTVLEPNIATAIDEALPDDDKASSSGNSSSSCSSSCSCSSSNSQNDCDILDIHPEEEEMDLAEPESVPDKTKTDVAMVVTETTLDNVVLETS